jgi:hypothetical protein
MPSGDPGARSLGRSVRSGAARDRGSPVGYWLGLGLSIMALGLSIIALGLSIIALGLSIIALGLSIIALGLSCIIALGLGLAPGWVQAATMTLRPTTPTASNPDSFRGDRYM